MKLAVLGGVALMCAATAFVAAQAPTPEEQTVIGCVRGDGTAKAPWVLAGVVIPPPAPAGRGGRGGPGGRGAGRQGGGPPPAPTPPPPPPPPIDLHVTGLDLTPWMGYRTQIMGMMGAPGAMREFKAESARSVFGTCPNPQ